MALLNVELIEQIQLVATSYARRERERLNKANGVQPNVGARRAATAGGGAAAPKG